ncbi:MAG: hypothetical protein HFG40_01825 [Bacilli bacterium]|nr:hypothetical protein [Bacilli bacterium]
MDYQEQLNKIKKHYEEIKSYADKIEKVSITIENRDPNFVYLMHTTSLEEGDIKDVYTKGVVYTGNQIWRTFNNLSKDWFGKSWAREKADQTSMEQVIVDQCKQGAFQCFLYKVPLVFFESINGSLFPIPIWYLDNSYTLKLNPSSSGTPYDISEKESNFFRIYPTLLLGHYDLRTNQFYKNPNYSFIFNNESGIYDGQQVVSIMDEQLSRAMWEHNESILSQHPSSFSHTIIEFAREFENSITINHKNKW